MYQRANLGVQRWFQSNEKKTYKKYKRGNQFYVVWVNTNILHDWCFLICSSLKISAWRFDNVSFHQRDSADCENLAEEYWGKGLKKWHSQGRVPNTWCLLASSFKDLYFQKKEPFFPLIQEPFFLLIHVCKTGDITCILPNVLYFLT